MICGKIVYQLKSLQDEPKNQASLIHESVIELIKAVGVNGKDAEILTDHFLKTLILVKLRKKKAAEVLWPLLLIKNKDSV
ncbi:MAG: hypothetical protein H0Z28_09260 [Archaeoglobus sp.]|nr:hypothetical protein [Archaeoglobus sp.]